MTKFDHYISFGSLYLITDNNMVPLPYNYVRLFQPWIEWENYNIVRGFCSVLQKYAGILILFLALPQAWYSFHLTILVFYILLGQLPGYSCNKL